LQKYGEQRFAFLYKNCIYGYPKKVHENYYLRCISGDIMQLLQYYMIFAGVAAGGFAVVLALFARIRAIKVEHEKAAKIALAIEQGAMTFLREEYKIIAIFVGLVAVILGFFLSPLCAMTFVVGSLISLSTGFIGMRAATLANVRTTMAAKNHGEHEAFMVSFFWRWSNGFCSC
jgi:K(+)-stimulated pyrophosphate-energized sodium pump